MTPKNNKFDEIFNRLLSLGIKTQKELGELLGLNPTTINGARKRGTFPKKWVSILCQLYDVTPEWILGIQTEVPRREISPEMNLITSLARDVEFLSGKINSLQRELNQLKGVNHLRLGGRGSPGEEETSKKGRKYG
ncbi:MAG: hypothetical protein KAV87_12870 [Desulfobacteraceae bacterium]|nr:hypothetical protein [Desulfobacteraceae bacterium]